MDTLTADTLAASLQASKKALLAKVLRTLGQERCQAIFTEACAICSGSHISSGGLANIASGGLTITAHIHAAGLRLFVSGLTVDAQGSPTSIAAHLRCKSHHPCRHKRFREWSLIVLGDVR